MRSAVFTRRAAEGLAERLVEAAEGAEARTEGYGDDLVADGHEQPLGVRQAVLNQVLDQRGADARWNRPMA